MTLIMTHIYDSSFLCDSMMSKEEKLHEQWNTNFESNIGSDRIILVKVDWGQIGVKWGQTGDSA